MSHYSVTGYWIVVLLSYLCFAAATATAAGPKDHAHTRLDSSGTKYHLRAKSSSKEYTQPDVDQIIKSSEQFVKTATHLKVSAEKRKERMEVQKNELLQGIGFFENFKKDLPDLGSFFKTDISKKDHALKNLETMIERCLALYKNAEQLEKLLAYNVATLYDLEDIKENTLFIDASKTLMSVMPQRIQEMQDTEQYLLFDETKIKDDCYTILYTYFLGLNAYTAKEFSEVMKLYNTSKTERYLATIKLSNLDAVLKGTSKATTKKLAGFFSEANNLVTNAGKAIETVVPLLNPLQKAKDAYDNVFQDFVLSRKINHINTAIRKCKELLQMLSDQVVVQLMIPIEVSKRIETMIHEASAEEFMKAPITR